MPAIHQIDNEAKLITTTWEGEAVDNDFIEALKNYQEDILIKPEYYDYNEIVDLRNITRLMLSARGLIKIGKIASSTDEHRAKTKLAFIVASDLAYNFVKLYATYRNYGRKPNKIISVFKREEDALEWLHGNA